MSLAGAGWIMASYAVFPNLRSFRHRLITGLAISDAFMALNFLFSTAMNVGGNGIAAPENTAFCSFNGFVTQVFVIQTDYWVLTIAVCTYFILAGHKTQSTWIQDHELVIWALPWLFSVLWASIGLGVTGYENIGACEPCLVTKRPSLT
ncbi:G-protein-coupled receptor 1 [Colletotrichum higginsianum]|nr:G-protein-coupled receptor 1 [Colletotrichum higginsianum]